MIKELEQSLIIVKKAIDLAISKGAFSTIDDAVIIGQHYNNIVKYLQNGGTDDKGNIVAMDNSNNSNASN